MNYLSARKYRKVVTDFEKLANKYWAALPEQHRSDFGEKFVYEESNESEKTREEICELLPYVEEAAQSFGINYTLRSYPAPAVGGPVIPVNIFRSVINPEIGHCVLDRKIITDTLIMARSVSYKAEGEALLHMLNPWNWFVDSCALFLRIPFIILRRAGVPAKVEENIWANVVKAVLGFSIIGFLFYRGLVSIDDIATYVKSKF